MVMLVLDRLLRLAALMLAVSVCAQPGDFCAVERAKVASDDGSESTAPAPSADAVGDRAERPAGGDRAIGDTVFPSDPPPRQALGDYDPEQDAIILFENWRPPVVQHLVMHQFTAGYMGWPSADAREMRALFEGFAMVMERLLGYDVDPPQAPTLAASLALPDWQGICDGGKQLVKAFDKIAAATSQEMAKDVLIKAIKGYEDLNGDDEASFAEYSVALIKSGPGFEFTRQVVIAFDDIGVLREPQPEAKDSGTTPPS